MKLLKILNLHILLNDKNSHKFNIKRFDEILWNTMSGGQKRGFIIC